MDLSGLSGGSGSRPRTAGVVLPRHLRQPVVVVVLDLQHLEAVQVHDDLEPGHRMGVRVAVRGRPQPDVAPAEAPVAPLLGHHRCAVGPDVEQHQARVGDAAPGHARRAPPGARAAPRRCRGTRRRSRWASSRAPASRTPPGRRSGRRPPRTASFVRRSQSTANARRGTGSPGRHASSSALAGSARSSEANRQDSVVSLLPADDLRGRPDLVGGERVERMHASSSTQAGVHQY